MDSFVNMLINTFQFITINTFALFDAIVLVEFFLLIVVIFVTKKFGDSIITIGVIKLM